MQDLELNEEEGRHRYQPVIVSEVHNPRIKGQQQHGNRQRPEESLSHNDLKLHCVREGDKVDVPNKGEATPIGKNCLDVVKSQSSLDYFDSVVVRLIKHEPSVSHQSSIHAD